MTKPENTGETGPTQEKPTVGSPLFERFLQTASLRRRRMSVYISLFAVAISVNLTSEYREVFEANMYIFRKRNVQILHLNML
jgi:hypothetical protein